MAMDPEEYEKMKRQMAEERQIEKVEREEKAREFKKMRDEEIVTVGEMRLHIASRVAATLASNMMIDADAIVERSFDIADRMIKHIADELDKG